jgi:glycerophosphoryl diester phosphodiesterase
MPYLNVPHPEERPALRDAASRRLLRMTGVRLEGRTAPLQIPSVIGHRGAAAHAPENTLAGLRRAKALGCDWVEFDVRLTGDGAPVLCHDAHLDRTTSGRGLVSGTSLAAIRECDAGSWFGPSFTGERVPTLDEALVLAAELGLGANVELKSDRGREYATAAAVASTVRRLAGRAPMVVASSFLVSALVALRELAPEVPRAVLFRLVPRGWAEVALRLGCTMIGADHRRLRPRRIAGVRAAGFRLAAYTVNDPARANLLFEWGVTSVFSDAPDIIRSHVIRPDVIRGASAGRRPAWARQGANR